MQIRISGAGIAGLVVAAVMIAGLARGASADAGAAAPAPPTVEQRLANLEAYVTNGAPNGGALAAPRARPQRLDDDRRGARAVHDAARAWRCSTAAWSAARTCSRSWRSASASPAWSRSVVGLSATASRSRTGNAVPRRHRSSRCSRASMPRPNTDYAVLGLAERVLRCTS